MTGREVSKVLVSNGYARGVETVDGEQFVAKEAVVGAIHPHVLDQLVEDVKSSVIERAKQSRLAAYSIMVVHYALYDPLQHHPHVELGDATTVYFADTAQLSEFLQRLGPLRNGRVPSRPITAASDGSRFDKTRVPDGRALMYQFAYMPYRLATGGAREWDEIKESVADCLQAHVAPFYSNLTPDNIVQRVVDSPLDMERTSPSFREGDIHGGGPFLYRDIATRPTPDLSQFTVPGVRGLYLVGPFMAPGAGVLGGGRLTAIKIFEDLGLDFKRIALG
jgi:phytoene dehydrogenase-like protein